MFACKHFTSNWLQYCLWLFVSTRNGRNWHYTKTWTPSTSQLNRFFFNFLWGQRQRKNIQQLVTSGSTHCCCSSTCQWWNPTGANSEPWRCHCEPWVFGTLLYLVKGHHGHHSHLHQEAISIWERDIEPSYIHGCFYLTSYLSCKIYDEDNAFPSQMKWKFQNSYEILTWLTWTLPLALSFFLKGTITWPWSRCWRPWPKLWRRGVRCVEVAFEDLP